MTAAQLVSDIPNFHMYLTFAVICIAIASFASERIALELSAIGTILLLIVFFYIFPLPDRHGQNMLDATRLLSGFANPVLFTILSLLIIGQGLFHTGAVERPAQVIAKLGRAGSVVAFGVTLLIAGSISAFLNNTPVVVIFIPIVTAITTQLETSPSRLLMPLSFITILGGMTTLIGSSANLIAASLAEASGIKPIGFFDFLVPGLVLAGVGAIYVIFILPYMLKSREEKSTPEAKRSGRQFIAQITITPSHPWLGSQAKAGLFPELKHLTVRLVQRGNKSILPPFEDVSIETGDVVIVAGTRKVLTELVKELRDSLPMHQVRALMKNEEANGTVEGAIRQQLSMVEAVVAPGSRLAGLTIEHATFLSEMGCTVFGLQRQSRMLRRPMKDITLEAGDVLLLLGTRESIRNLRANRALITLEWSASELPITHHVQRAIMIFAITIAVAASGLLPIAIAAMGGALAMIMSGCLNVRQAARAIDRRIYLLVGTAFALAEPLRVTGGAEFVAHGVVNIFSGLGPAVLLSAFFLLTAVLTNFLSNHATAALLAPVAVSAAREIGVPPEPFVFGLIFALNCSFATPIAYQTNLIVMGPGRYSFRDFLYGGVPLTIIVWLTYSFFAPFYFNL